MTVNERQIAVDPVRARKKILRGENLVKQFADAPVNAGKSPVFINQRIGVKQPTGIVLVGAVKSQRPDLAARRS
jgi:hypothetical protein